VAWIREWILIIKEKSYGKLDDDYGTIDGRIGRIETDVLMKLETLSKELTGSETGTGYFSIRKWLKELNKRRSSFSRGRCKKIKIEEPIEESSQIIPEWLLVHGQFWFFIITLLSVSGYWAIRWHKLGGRKSESLRKEIWLFQRSWKGILRNSW